MALGELGRAGGFVTSAGTGELSIERCGTGAAMLALREPWSELYQDSDAPPFLRWEWLYPSWRRVTPAREPRVHVARDADGRVRGLLPLSLERRGIATVLRFLGDTTIGSDRLDVVGAAGGPAVAEALWRDALDDPTWDVAELLDLDQASPSVPVLCRLAAERGLPVEELPRYRCPTISLPARFDELLARVPGRETLLRRRRWFATQPGFAIDVARAPLEIAGALGAFLHLHALRWSAEGGSQAITSPSIASFHRDAAWWLAERDAVRFYTLRLDGRALASLYVLRHGRYRAMYQSGYDPAFAQRSPGVVLLARSIEDAIAEGASEYDLLRGDEAYKQRWADRERRTVGVRLVRPRLAGRLHKASVGSRAAVRRIARHLLPERLVDLLRRRLPSPP